MGSTAILTMYVAPFIPQPSVTSGGNETVNLISTSSEWKTQSRGISNLQCDIVRPWL